MTFLQSLFYQGALLQKGSGLFKPAFIFKAPLYLIKGQTLNHAICLRASVKTYPMTNLKLGTKVSIQKEFYDILTILIFPRCLIAKVIRTF
jgi:hypothetical protein